jgi:hypothetical protein
MTRLLIYVGPAHPLFSTLLVWRLQVISIQTIIIDAP